MRIIIVALLSGMLSAPAFAADPRALCTPSAAVWAYGETPEPLAGRAASIPLPEGAATHAWECRVGAHTLTVRSAREVRAQGGPCGACDLGWATVWIDRRRIAPGEAVGDWDLEMRHADQVLRSVALSPDGVAVCRDAYDDANERIGAACTTLSFTEVRRTRRDPAFVSVGAREPFRWVLWEGSERQCAALTAALARPDQIRGASDPSFAALRLETEWSGASGAGRTARFDIDNDGRDDSVTIEFQRINRDEIDSEHWSWISGGEGAYDVPLLDRLNHGQTGLNPREDSYAAFVFTPIRWRERTLLYARLRPNSGTTEEALSAQLTRREAAFEGRRSDRHGHAHAHAFRQPLSRGLIELASDGGARLVCGWTPNSRAEDRL